MKRNRPPHCPNCNVLLTEAGPYMVDLGGFLGSMEAKMFECPNTDEHCGFFTIIGEKATATPPPDGGTLVV